MRGSMTGGGVGLGGRWGGIAPSCQTTVGAAYRRFVAGPTFVVRLESA